MKPITSPTMVEGGIAPTWAGAVERADPGVLECAEPRIVVRPVEGVFERPVEVLVPAHEGVFLRPRPGYLSLDVCKSPPHFGVLNMLVFFLDTLDAPLSPSREQDNLEDLLDAAPEVSADS